MSACTDIQIVNSAAKRNKCNSEDLATQINFLCSIPGIRNWINIVNRRGMGKLISG